MFHINFPKEASPGLDFSLGGSLLAVAERRSGMDCIAVYSCDSWKQNTVNNCSPIDETIVYAKYSLYSLLLGDRLRSYRSRRPKVVPGRFQNRRLGRKPSGPVLHLLVRQKRMDKNVRHGRRVWRAQRRVVPQRSDPRRRYRRIESIKQSHRCFLVDGPVDLILGFVDAGPASQSLVMASDSYSGSLVPVRSRLC